MQESTQDPHDLPMVQKFVSVLWPSFLTAGVATILFFTVFDPQDLAAIIGADGIQRLEAYSIGFFLFWMLTATSCALTCYFRKPSEALNRRRH